MISSAGCATSFHQKPGLIAPGPVGREEAAQPERVLTARRGLGVIAGEFSCPELPTGPLSPLPARFADLPGILRGLKRTGDNGA